MASASEFDESLLAARARVGSGKGVNPLAMIVTPTTPMSRQAA